MKYILGLVIVCLLASNQVLAQYEQKKFSVIEKEGITILNVREDNPIEFLNIGKDQRFELDAKNKGELIIALDKAVAWGQINTTKQLSFSKRVAEVQRYYRIDKLGEGASYPPNEMNIIFTGKEDGTHVITLYISSASGFDIEQPGTQFWRFANDQQIKQLITSLEKQSVDLDAFFK